MFILKNSCHNVNLFMRLRRKNVFVADNILIAALCGVFAFSSLQKILI